MIEKMLEGIEVRLGVDYLENREMMCAVAGHFVDPWLYNIGTTVLNGGDSMVVFFVVNKIVFSDAKPDLVENN